METSFTVSNSDLERDERYNTPFDLNCLRDEALDNLENWVNSDPLLGCPPPCITPRSLEGATGSDKCFQWLEIVRKQKAILKDGMRVEWEKSRKADVKSAFDNIPPLKEDEKLPIEPMICNCEKGYIASHQWDTHYSCHWDAEGKYCILP